MRHVLTFLLDHIKIKIYDNKDIQVHGGPFQKVVVFLAGDSMNLSCWLIFNGRKVTTFWLLIGTDSHKHNWFHHL
jgi:hypothetical protein